MQQPPAFGIRRSLTPFLLLVLTVSTGPAIAQEVVFREIPRNLQLFPRDANDSADLIFAGTVTSAGRDSVRLEVYRDGQLLETDRAGLLYQEGAAPFRLVAPIHAELSEYSARFYLDDSLMAVRDSLVCGDVFLINGQSNAVADDQQGLATATSEWFRSFGSSSYDADACRADTTWGLAQGHVTYTHGSVGVWGLTVGLSLSSNYHLPVAIINGAVGGTQIAYHLRNDVNPTDLTTIYGRLLWRAIKAGVQPHIRAMLWHQGEWDTFSDPTDYYDGLFTSLYNAWHHDYGQIEKVYAFQIHQGCGGDFQSEMREYQRTMPHRFPDLEVVSTMGISGHDGCHYGYNGYRQMARWLLGPLTQNLYGSQDTWNITPPNVQDTWFTPSHDEVRVQFDTEVRWPADTLNAAMRDYFYVNGNGEEGRVSFGRVLEDGRTLSLRLFLPVSQADRVSYLPGCYYPGGGIYEGPWVRNPRGIGALSFLDFPIQEISGVERTEPISLPQLVSCAPNPSSGETTIRFREEAAGPIRLEIFDAAGRLIRTLMDRPLPPAIG